GFERSRRKAKLITVELQSFVDGPHGDAQVIDFVAPEPAVKGFVEVQPAFRYVLACSTEFCGGKAIQEPFAEHFAKAKAPDFWQGMALPHWHSPNGFKQLDYACAFAGDGAYHARDPAVFGMCESQGALQVALQFVCTGQVRFVDREHLSDLHD